MANRAINMWRANTLVSGWSKDQVTVNTTGLHIITVQINDPTYQDATVDGQTIRSNALILLASPDPVSPSADPFVSMQVVPTESGGIYGVPDYGTPTFTDTGYGYYSGTIFLSGAAASGVYAADYAYNSMADYEQALENGEIVPLSGTVYFDVYINGTNKPSIFINWTAPDELSPVGCKPRIWMGCQAYTIPEAEYVTKDGVVWPNEDIWYIDDAGEQSYGGSYQTNYLAVQDHFENTSFMQLPGEKLAQWGFNGDPEHIQFYLRMDYLDNIGDLQRSQIELDGTPSNQEIEDSSHIIGQRYTTVVRFHTGEPDYIPPQDPEGYPGGRNIDDDGPGKYDPDNIPDPADFTDPVGFDGNAVLTKTYVVSSSTLQNIGQKLWSQDYFNVLKIQTNPIENIVSVKHFPFAQATGTTQEIKIGDVAFGVNGLKVPSVYEMPIGSYTLHGHFKNYLDMAPFTTVKIHLPYIGLFQLDPADILECKLGVKYYVDLVTGQCMAKLILDEDQNGKSIPYMTVFGNMGVDIPITSTDRVQVELRAASATVSAMGGVAGHLLGGDALGAAVNGATGALNIAGADVTSQRTASQSPACASFDTPDVYLLIERPASEYVETTNGTPSGYKHLHGQPSNKYRSLGNYPAGSFVQVDKRTDIKIAMTSQENAMLEQLLTEGVYI